jgi:hypothetical protein
MNKESQAMLTTNLTQITTLDDSPVGLSFFSIYSLANEYIRMKT